MDENTKQPETALAVTAPESNLMTVNKALSYCSFDTSSPAGKARLYNAMSNPDERISAHINEEIVVVDVYAEMIDITNEDTGEVTSCPRVILIDPNDTSFVAVSTGIYGDVKRLLQIFGEPSTWEKPIHLKVKQVQIKKGSMLKLQLVG